MEIWKNLSLEDMEGEIWKDIEGYEGLYQVSNMGRVKSLKRKVNANIINNVSRTVRSRILKQSINCDGYLRIALHREMTSKNFPVHRLVAKAFIPNPNNKPTIDHINTVRTDNRVCNLRWATPKEQFSENEISRERIKEVNRLIGKRTIKFAIEASKKRVRCLTTSEEFNSIREAAKKYKIQFKNITACCRGKRKSCGKLPDGTKLTWEYID